MQPNNTIGSKVYAKAIQCLSGPVDHFIETGFYNLASAGEYGDGWISEPQVRRICREIAKEQKRPFIQASEYYATNGYDQAARKPYKLDKPIWNNAWIEMPKRKYLLPLATPLLLASGDNDTTYKPGDAIMPYRQETIWSWRIVDKSFWDEYYNFILNDPDCRRARKLTS